MENFRDFPICVVKTLAGDMIGHFDVETLMIYRPRLMVPQRVSQTQMGLALMDVFGPFLEGTNELELTITAIICHVVVPASNTKLLAEYQSATSPIQTATSPILNLGGNYK